MTELLTNDEVAVPDPNSPIVCRKCGSSVWTELRTNGFIVYTKEGFYRERDTEKKEIRCVGCDQKPTLAEADQIRATSVYREAAQALGDLGMADSNVDGNLLDTPVGDPDSSGVVAGDS